MRALTLVETIVVIAITTAILVAISVLYVGGIRGTSFEQAVIDVGRDASLIIDTTHDAALQSDRIMSTHAFSGTTYTSGTTTVIFEVPMLKSDGTILSGAYDYIAITATGTNVYRLIDTASTSVRTSGSKRLTSILNALSFTYDTSDPSQAESLYVDATTSESSHTQTATLHTQGHFYLRNL